MNARTATALRQSHAWADHLEGMIAAAIVFVGAFFIFNPIQPMAFTGAMALSENVVEGQEITLRWSEEWRRLCPGRSTRYAQTKDGEVRTLDGIDVIPPMLPGMQERDRAVVIPLGFPPGRTIMWTEVKQQCWPWQAQAFKVDSPRVVFTVLSSASK